MAKTVVRDLGDQELLEELANRRKVLFELRFKLATGSLETTSKLKAEKQAQAAKDAANAAGGSTPKP